MLFYLDFITPKWHIDSMPSAVYACVLTDSDCNRLHGAEKCAVKTTALAVWKKETGFEPHALTFSLSLL